MSKQMPDFWNLIAHERGCPPGWRWLELKAIGEDRKNGATLATGGVYSTLFKSGTRKGKTNYKKPDPGTAREILITFAELDATIEKWESETGICRDCGGDGQKSYGWANGASILKDCKRCNATGKAVLK